MQQISGDNANGFYLELIIGFRMVIVRVFLGFPSEKNDLDDLKSVLEKRKAHLTIQWLFGGKDEHLLWVSGTGYSEGI